MKILAVAAALASGLVVWFIQGSCSTGAGGDTCNIAKGLSFWFWPISLLIFWLIIRFVMRLFNAFSKSRNLDRKK
jgi:hypothetical protein